MSNEQTQLIYELYNSILDYISLLELYNQNLCEINVYEVIRDLKDYKTFLLFHFSEVLENGYTKG